MHCCGAIWTEMFWTLLCWLKDSFASDLNGNAILNTLGVKPVPLNRGVCFQECGPAISEQILRSDAGKNQHRVNY